MKTQIGISDGDFFSFLDFSLCPNCGLGACYPVLGVRNAGVRCQAEVREEDLHGGVNADGVCVQYSKKMV